MKRMIWTFLACLLAAGVPVWAQETTEIQLLATSDLHGKMLGWDYFLDEPDPSGSLAQAASAIRGLRTDNTLLIDAGDLIQDNCADLFLDDTVHPMILGLNSLDYDVFVTGNHEYNYGMETLSRVLEMPEAKVLAGNVYDPDGKPIAESYAIFERSGVKIGVIGMVTPNIAAWDKVNLTGYRVADPVEETRALAAELRDQVDILIAAEHMDLQNELELAHSGVIDLANACPELDVIIAAHGHHAVDGEIINGVLVVENENAGKTLSRVILSMEKNGESWNIRSKEAEVIPLSDYPEDAETAELLHPFDERAKADGNAVIGIMKGGSLVPEYEIRAVPAPLVMDTPYSDLIGNVMRYYSGADAVCVVLNREDTQLNEGEILKKDVSLIYKYPNGLYTLRMNGRQLKQFMEWSAEFYNRYVPGDLTVSFNPERRSYLYTMLEGLRYDIDISQPEGSRIRNLTFSDGREVEADESYVIAASNYLASSIILNPGVIYEPDDMPQLLEMDIRSDIGTIRDMIVHYIRNVLGGELTPECNGNWQITGTDWDPELHQQAVDQINAGLIDLIPSEDDRTPNTVSITVNDLK